jgi:branched-chain amino acid transport system ATP-binding protein
MSLLELRGVRAGYGRLPVLFSVDLTVEDGEWVTVVGANGAGRSTLLKTILGGTALSAGEIFFRGGRISHEPPHRRVAAGISMVPEGRRILPTLTVKENLDAGAYGMTSRDAAAQSERVYELFPKLEQRAGQRAGSLSGGEQQMLAIGRALMSRPGLLLVDELSLGLAPIVVKSLLASLGGLRERGLALLVVDQEHVHASLARYSDRQLILEKGRFVSESAWNVGAGAVAAAGMMGGNP